MQNPVEQLFDDLPQDGASFSLLKSWMKARGDRIIPRKSDFERAISADLALNPTIVEVRAPDNLRYVRGSATSKELFGLDRTGKNMIDLTNRAYRAARAEFYWRIAYRPCVAKNILGYPIAGKLDAFINCINLSLPVCPNDDANPMEIYITVEPTTDPYSDALMKSYYESRRPRRLVPITLSFDFYDLGNGTDPIEVPSPSDDRCWPASSRHFEA